MRHIAILWMSLLTGLSPSLYAATRTTEVGNPTLGNATLGNPTLGNPETGDKKTPITAPKLEDFALCASSWYEFRLDPKRMNPYALYFAQNFSRDQSDLAFIPKVKTSVLSAPVERIFPMSAGSGADNGLGFSLVLKADIDSVQKAVEKILAQKMQCGESEGVQLCLLEINENKSIKIMPVENADGLTTSLGCFYRYPDVPAGE